MKTVHSQFASFALTLGLDVEQYRTTITSAAPRRRLAKAKKRDNSLNNREALASCKLSGNTSGRDLTSPPDHPRQTAENTTGQTPELTFSSFLASLSPLNTLAKGFNKGRPSSKTEAQWAKDLTAEEVGQSLDESWPELRQEVIDQFQQLKQQDTVDARDLNDKFSAAEGSFTFTYGGMAGACTRIVRAVCVCLYRCMRAHAPGVFILYLLLYTLHVYFTHYTRVYTRIYIHMHIHTSHAARARHAGVCVYLRV